MKVIKKMICKKGDGFFINKGKIYDVIEEHENTYRIISNNIKGKEYYPYINKTRLNDL
jgi:hypothetical protein